MASRSFIRRHLKYFGLTVLTPSMLSAQLITPSEYPIDAVTAGQQGQTVVAFDVGEDGKPSNCIVTAPSGFETLDNSACAVVLKRTFDPNRDEHGKPVKGSHKIRIDWVLPPEVVKKLGPGDGFPVIVSREAFSRAKSVGRLTANASLDIDEKGQLLECRLLDSTGVDNVDAKICKTIKRKGVFRPGFDSQGHVKRATVTQPITLVSEH